MTTSDTGLMSLGQGQGDITMITRPSNGQFKMSRDFAGL